MFRKWQLLILSILLGLLLSCSEEAPQKPFGANIRNVIIVAIDTLRSYNLGFMSYDRLTSPFLDEFSKRCVVFNSAYTPRAITLPAFASMFSGQHVVSNQVNENGFKISPDLHLLTEDFRKAGFLTIGFPASEVISSKYGINKGFDHYSDISDTPGAQVPASDIINKVRQFLEGNPVEEDLSFQKVSKPIFLFIHFFDTHTPYTPKPAYLKLFADLNYDGPFNGNHKPIQAYNLYELEFNDADLQHATDMYDAEIRTLDDYLRELFSLFERTGLMDNSVICFTADHGENLGEHHYITHGRPYEQGLSIPLMFHFPNDFLAGTNIEALVEFTDVLPTLMDVVNVPSTAKVTGRSLLPLIQDPDPQKPHRKFLLAKGGIDAKGRAGYSLFDGTYRLLFRPEESVLYNISTDPFETKDIAEEYPDLVKQMEAIITMMIEGLTPDDTDVGSTLRKQEMDPETEEMLRSLGYLN